MKNPPKQKKPRYSIFFAYGEWTATTTEFPYLSGISSTPLRALRELNIALGMARKVQDEDAKLHQQKKQAALDHLKATQPEMFNPPQRRREDKRGQRA